MNSNPTRPENPKSGKSQRRAPLKSEIWYRQIFEKSGAASIVIDPDMTISMANVEFERLSGYAKSEIEHRMKWSEFIVPDDLSRMKAYHYARRNGDQTVPEEYECQVVNRSGDVRDIYIKVGLLPDGKRSMASFMDITDLKQAQREVQKSRAALSGIIEAVEGLIYACNREYRIVFMNRAMVDKIGRDASGEWCYTALYGYNAPCPECSAQAAFEGRTLRREFQGGLDDRWYYAITSPVIVPDETVSTIETLMIDITERKHAEQALEEQAAYFREENIRLKSSMKERFRFGDIIGKSRAMQDVYENIVNAAATDANVIIYGESGTGKELAARAIHQTSDRKTGPFVVINCGAIPGKLMESEFFGYRRGAFTGADRDKTGYLDSVEGGTLFLDEISEITLPMQVKLLRVIEGNGFLPLGGHEARYPDLRIVAATNREPKSLVREGRMREDYCCVGVDMPHSDPAGYLADLVSFKYYRCLYLYGALAWFLVHVR